MRKLFVIAWIVVPAVPALADADAVLTQVRGPVALRLAGTSSTHPARPLQPLAAGTALELGPNAEAVVVCATDHAVALRGPTAWTLDARSCVAGRSLLGGSFARLVPQAGRIASFDGGLHEQAPSRSGDDEGKVPILYSPRSPQRRAIAITQASPEIVWAAVRDALAYELALTRGENTASHRIEASAALCKPDPRWRQARLCRAPWPFSPLVAGTTSELRVQAHTADPDWRVRIADPSKLTLADAATRTAIRSRVEGLANAGLPPASEQLLRASAFAEAELYNEAAAALAASLEDRPVAALAVRLANLYLGLGLLTASLDHYRSAEQWLPRTGENDTRAAINLGLGRYYLRNENPHSAVRHFEKAVAFYRRLGWDEQATRAAAEAERAGRGAR